MDDFKIGERIWWFESECGSHWTVCFDANGLYLKNGIIEKIKDGNFLMPGTADEYYRSNYTGKIYKSKNQAIEDLQRRIKEF